MEPLAEQYLDVNVKARCRMPEVVEQRLGGEVDAGAVLHVVDRVALHAQVEGELDEELLHGEREVMDELGRQFEAAVIRTYIEWLVDVPWKKTTRDRIDLAEAKAMQAGIPGSRLSIVPGAGHDPVRPFGEGGPYRRVQEAHLASRHRGSQPIHAGAGQGARPSRWAAAG